MTTVRPLVFTRPWLACLPLAAVALLGCGEPAPQETAAAAPGPAARPAPTPDAPAAPAAPPATAAGAPSPATEPSEAAPAPAAEEAPAAEGAPAGVFANGQFRIDAPFALDFTTRGSRHELQTEHAGTTFRFSFQVLDEATVGHTAALFRAATAAAGDGARLQPGRLGSWICQRHEGREGAEHRAVVAWVADETLFVLQASGSAPVAEALSEISHSFAVLEPSGGVDRSLDATSEADVTNTLQATRREAARAPRSARPGAPSFGASCNMTAANGSCHEVPESGREAFVCGAVGTHSESLPCPGAERVGSCVLPEGARVIHYYRGERSQLERMCGLLRGEFEARRRPWPRNAE